jgi:hypothetical protein
MYTPIAIPTNGANAMNEIPNKGIEMETEP